MGKCIQGESAKTIIKVDLFYSIPMLSECAALSHWWCLENISMVIAKWLTLRFQIRILFLAASIIRMQSKIKKLTFSYLLIGGHLMIEVVILSQQSLLLHSKE